MPNRCCVPFCKGNYPSGPKVRLFSFPRDEEIKKKWLMMIQRQNFSPSQNHKVCERHFQPNNFEDVTSAYDSTTGKLVTAPLNAPRLKKTAVPSIFPDYPVSCVKQVSNRISPDSRKEEKENLQLQKAIEDNLQTQQEYENKRKINSFNNVKTCISTFGLPDKWISIPTENSVCLLNISCDPEPVLNHSVRIDESLLCHVNIKNVPIKQLGSSFVFPMPLKSFSEIESLLGKINELKENTESVLNLKYQIIKDLLMSVCHEDNEHTVKFIIEQVSLLSCDSKNNFRYSTEMLVFASLMNSISPRAYHFLRQSGNIIIPHQSTLRNVCRSLPVSPEMEQHDEYFLMYIKHRIRHLKPSEYVVILQIDEIHIKPFYDYKGGNIVGMSHDVPAAATSVYAFMISSVLSPFKEVAHVLPVKNISHDALFVIIGKVVTGLEKIGLKVICVITDNNAINRKAMSFFSSPPQLSIVYPHPCDNIRPLFFLIDSVHLFKNIRNNWLNQRNPGKCMFYPKFYDDQDAPSKTFCTASFTSLQQLHDIESSSMVKYAYGLTLKSLSPSNLERQSVKLALKIFNKFVIEGLKEVGHIHEIPHHLETADFISIALTWWDIMNVKTPVKGIRHRNVYMEPLKNCETDKKVIFLSKFIEWLDKWKTMKCSTGGFSKETHNALRQTTYGMLELCRYCTEELNMNFILPGKFQTDNLEDRFGKYRQLAGSQYHISVRQLLECERKLRIQSSIQLELQFNSQTIVLNDFDEACISGNVDDNTAFPVTVNIADLKKHDIYLPVLTYVGGYCCYSVLKQIKCDFCKEHLTLPKAVSLTDEYKLIKNLDRGGLSCPRPPVVNAVLYTYVVTDKLCSDYEQLFFKLQNQRNFVTRTVIEILDCEEMQLFEGCCQNGHTADDLCKKIVWTATNIFLKNMCSKKNDTCKNIQSNKKRKLATLNSKV